MPYDAFEDLSKKIAQGSGDVKDSLEGIIGAAEDADHAYKKLTRTQEASLKIEEKFEKALNLTSKALSVVGHSSMSAARGLKVIDTISKSAAGNLNAIGAGAHSAASGFKALSTVANSFSSDISGAEKGIAGLVQHLKKIPTKAILPSLGGGLPPKQSIAKMFGAAGKGIPPQSIANMFKVNLPSSATPLAQTLAGNQSQAKNATKRAMIKTGRSVSDAMSKIRKDISRESERGKGQLELLGEDLSTTGKKKQYIELSVKIRKERELEDFLDKLDPKKGKVFAKDVKKLGLQIAIDNLLKSGGEDIDLLKLRMRKAGEEAEEAATRMTSPLAKLEDEMNKEARTLPQLFRKTFAAGGVEASKFAEGLGGTATGMLAVGVAGAFLATKLSEVVDRFADAVIGLAKYRTETAALERTILGMNKGALEQMRKQLSLTKQQASEFFSVVEKGVNELGMSQEQIMKVSKALQETFGGDQTDRLKKYVDILETIPTIETDLKVTSSMDDQTKAIFGLIKTGKMGAVADLSAAGLFGGTQQKMSGADTANAAATTAANTAGIKDSLLKFFPDFGFGFTATVAGLGSVASGMLGMVAALGGLKLLTGQASAANLQSRSIATSEIITAINSPKAGMGGKSSSANVVGGGGGGKGFGKFVKGGIVAIAGMAIGYALDKASDKMEKEGNKKGAAGAKMGGSALRIAGAAGTGAMIGSAFPGLGTAIGAVVGGAVGLAAEFKNLSTSVKTLTSGAEKLEKSQEEISDVVRGGMALGLALSKIEKAMDSARFKLVDFNKGLAASKAGLISAMGGGNKQFSKASGEQFTTAAKAFGDRVRELSKQRDENRNVPGRTAAQQEVILADLDKRLVDATRELIDSFQNATEVLLQSPSIIQSGLEVESKRAMLGARVEAGSIAGEEKAAKKQEILNGMRREAALKDEAYTKARERLLALQTDLDESSNQDKAKNVSEYEQLVKRLGKGETQQVTRAKKMLEEAKAAYKDYGSVEDAQSNKSQLEEYVAAQKDVTGGAGARRAKIIKEMPAGLANRSLKSTEETLAEATRRKKEVDKYQKFLEVAESEQGALKIKKDTLASALKGGAGTNREKAGEMLKAEELKSRALEERIGRGDDSKKTKEEYEASKQTQVWLKEMADGATVDTMYAKLRNAQLQEYLKNQATAWQAELDAADSFKGELTEKKRNVQTLGRSAIIASMTGDGIKENAELNRAQVDLDWEIYKSYEASVKIAKDKLVEQESLLKLAEKDQAASEKTGTIGAEKKLAVEKKGIDVGLAKRNVAAIEEKAGEARAKIPTSQKSMDAAQAAYNDTLAAQGVRAANDLAEAMMSNAEISGNLKTTSAEAYKIVVAAAKKEFEAQKKVTAAWKEGDDKRIAAAVEAAGGESSAAGKELKLEMKSTQEAILQAKMKKDETDFARAGLDIARKVTDLRSQEADIQQGVIDDAMSFASEFGSSFAAVNKLQQLSVGVARQRLDIANEELDRAKEAANKTGATREDNIALMKAQANVATATLNLKRKELGVQKDIIEKMLGAAFGGINASSGARRGVGSDQALMGVGATRMKSAAGVYTNVPGGAPGTIEERAAQRGISGRGAGGAWGAAAGGEGGMGGALAAVNAAMNTSPARNPLEGEVSKATGRTADATESSAKSLEILAGRTGGGVAGTGGKNHTKEMEKTNKETKKNTEATKKNIVQEKKVTAETKKAATGFKGLTGTSGLGALVKNTKSLGGAEGQGAYEKNKALIKGVGGTNTGAINKGGGSVFGPSGTILDDKWNPAGGTDETWAAEEERNRLTPEEHQAEYDRQRAPQPWPDEPSSFIGGGRDGRDVARTGQWSASGAAGSASGTSNVQGEVTVTVKSDDNMFKDKVVRVLLSPEAKTNLGRAVFQ